MGCGGWKVPKALRVPRESQVLLALPDCRVLWVRRGFGEKRVRRVRKDLWGFQVLPARKGLRVQSARRDRGESKALRGRKVL